MLQLADSPIPHEFAGKPKPRIAPLLAARLQNASGFPGDADDVFSRCQYERHPTVGRIRLQGLGRPGRCIRYFKKREKRDARQQFFRQTLVTNRPEVPKRPAIHFYFAVVRNGG